MIRILCLETSTEVCSVAIVENGIVVDFREDLSGMNHSRLLTVFIDELLKANQLKASDFQAVSVSEGPGSYTGLRIGVSAAKGFCFAANLPLIAISPLASMAHQLINNLSQYQLELQPNDLFVPMIDARRMEVYCALFNSGEEAMVKVAAVIVDETTFAAQLENNRIVYFGNGAQKCQEIINSANAVYVDGINTSAVYMAELANQKFIANQFVDVAYFEPFYLKDFIATASKKNVFQF